MSGDFEGKKEKFREIMGREENLHIRDDPNRSRNADPLLVPVMIVNKDSCDVKIERDLKMDNYVTMWRRKLAPLYYLLKPGQRVVLPNFYVTFTAVDRPEGYQILLQSRYRKLVGGVRTFDYAD